VARGQETTGPAASGGEATHLTVLVSGVADPVNAGVVADGVVAGVDADDLVVLVGSILVDPVGVEDAGVGALAANTAFGHNLEGAGGLEVGDTLVLGLTVHNTLGALHLAATTADGNTLDAVTLLLLVSELAGLLRAGGVLYPVDVGELTVLPSADTEEEPQHVALLLLPDLLEVFVGTHVTRTIFPGQNTDTSNVYKYP